MFKIPKKSKYKNVSITKEGIRFDSTNELKRYEYLKLLENKGLISNLNYHNRKDIITIQSKPKISYIPDFTYFENGIFVVEDLKGFQTPEFKLKKKLIIGMLLRKELNFVFRLTKMVKENFNIIEEYNFFEES